MRRDSVALRKRKGLWMDDRSASLQRVADLAGDRFSWLLELGNKVAKANPDMGVSGVPRLAAVLHTLLRITRWGTCAVQVSKPR